MGNPKTQYVLKGFSQVIGFRVFAFDAIAPDRTRTAFTVRIDLALSRKYGIRLQELPLLCQEVLEHRDETDDTKAFTYTEEAMCAYASDCAQRAAAQKRKPPHRPFGDQPGAAWRVPQQ